MTWEQQETKIKEIISSHSSHRQSLVIEVEKYNHRINVVEIKRE